MTTFTDLTNRALQAIGTRTTVTDSELASNSTNEAIQANLIIQPYRRQLLRMAPWDCGLKGANLVYITSAPGTPENTSAAKPLWQPGQPLPPWAYEYQYPVDCLRACWMIPATQTGFAGVIPITTAVTGGAASFWNGPPVKFKVQTDQFYPVVEAAVAAGLGGSGFAIGDLVTLPIGSNTNPPIGAPVILMVTGVSAGVIDTVDVISQIPNTSSDPQSTGEGPQGGSYFVPQTNPVPQGTTSGSGTGASFNLTFGSKSSQRVILTNQEFATLVYVQDVLDPNIWDDLFQEAYAQVLGAGLVMALSGDKKLANGRIEVANRMIETARTADGNEGLTVNDITPDWIRIRGINHAQGYSGPYSGYDWGGMWPIFG